MTLPNIPKNISYCKWQDDILSFKGVQLIVENTLLVLKERQMEATVKKWTFIFGILWEFMVSIYFLF